MTPSPGEGALQFSGSVRFVGHGGLLHVLLDRPRIEVASDSALLTFTEYRTEALRSRRMTVAFLAWSAPRDEARYWRCAHVPAVLAPTGVELFNDVYPVGETLEPIQVRIPR